MAAFDLLIRGAKIFDGNGGDPVVGDIAIKDGRISARGRDLPADIARETIDASGLWLMPGLLDIHTHYDLELELAPGLEESVRHGTTTVVIANCSLGLAFGALRSGGADPVVDCFARVENVPKHVLRRVADKATWNDSAGYLDHLESLPLGPNVVPMIPYSMLRIAAMGTDAAVGRAPTAAELAEMERLLEKGMREGYPGFSSDGLPFHYLANDPNQDKRVPSQYATFAELKRLTGIVRRYGRLWQATPPTENPLRVLRTFLLTSARLYGRPLRTTAVAAMDVRSNRNIVRSARILARLLNSRLVGGQFHLQSLAARFKVWADGPVTPLSEEIPELRELMKPDLEDREARERLYARPDFEAAFKTMWRIGKSGRNLARLKRLLRLEDMALRRALEEMHVERAPVPSWRGQKLSEIFERLKRFQTVGAPAENEAERDAFGTFPPVFDDADFMFHLLKTYDRDLVWWTVSANVDPETVRALAMDPLFLPGFSDSGAHLTNIAFYDVNLRALRIAYDTRGEQGVGYMVRRLTRDAAELFNVDAGTIEPGAAADVVLVDPAKLLAHDGEASTRRIWREALANEQLVNRSDGVVARVLIRGETVWTSEGAAPALASRKFGRVLKARDAA